jgi:hypothetical protein
VAKKNVVNLLCWEYWERMICMLFFEGLTWLIKGLCGVLEIHKEGFSNLFITKNGEKGLIKPFPAPFAYILGRRD